MSGSLVYGVFSDCVHIITYSWLIINLLSRVNDPQKRRVSPIFVATTTCPPNFLVQQFDKTGGECWNNYILAFITIAFKIN